MESKYQPKTTQKAFLEKFLAKQRSKQILPFVKGKNVLDFGCGLDAWNANLIYSHCKNVVGIEQNQTVSIKVGKVNVFPSLNDMPHIKFDVVLALAVFEHIDPFALINILNQLSHFCSKDALLIGTAPTPRARPILEFLSFKLNLIDPTQTKDHKVYYDDLWLKTLTNRSRWTLISYKKFQLGCNARFVMGLDRSFQQHLPL